MTVTQSSTADWRPTLEVLARSLQIGLDQREARAFQQRNLSRIVSFAAANSAFYRQRLAPAMTRQGLVMSRWSDVPVLTKDELRANRDGIRIDCLSRESGAVRSGWTSGSEGEPLEYIRSALADQVSGKTTQRFMRWWKMDGRQRLAQIVATRQTTAAVPSPTMRRGWMEGCPTGEFHVYPVSTELQRHLDWLQSLRPAYLKTYPEVLAELARLTLRQGRLLRFSLLISGGGVLSEETRALCRDAFGCAVADFYGAEEVGGIAAQCPSCGEYHAADENLMLEILKEDGQPAAPGETGRAVVTTLFNEAFPLIRYHVGDHVEAGTAGVCPQPLLTLKRIRGRGKAIFRLSGGRTIWPFIPSGDMARLANVRRFQFVQVAEDQVEFHYVPRDPASGIDEARLAQIVKEFLDPSLRVTSRAVPAIVRDENLKYMLYRSLLST